MKLSNIVLLSDYTKTLEIHPDLNKKLWDDHIIKRNVLKQLQKIVADFVKENEIEVKILDVVLMGSSCDTNFTPKSDIDVHLVIQHTEASKEYELLVHVCKIWNGMHNVTIFGHKVEINPQTKRNPLISKDAAIYSIQNDKWIRKPVPHIITQQMRRDINTLCDKYSKDIKNKIKQEDGKGLDKILHDIKTKRKEGVHKDGEMSIDNLVFKALRNVGIINVTHDDIIKINDELLTLKKGS